MMIPKMMMAMRRDHRHAPAGATPKCRGADRDLAARRADGAVGDIGISKPRKRC
jgi:hypothetical protein